MDKKLVGLDEMAGILGTNKRHLYSLSEKGVVPKVKVGHLLRFDPDKVIEHLAQPANAGKKAKR